MAGVHLLSDAFVKAAIKEGKSVKVHDGGGLYLLVKRRSCSWLYRYTVTGARRSRYMGLGSARKVSLAQARKAAAEARELHLQGLDPIAERNKRTGALETVGAPSFEVAAERYLEVQTKWSAKHRKQWRRSLIMYVYPKIGSKPVDVITAKEIADALAPLWDNKRESAMRIRSRIEMVIESAFARDDIKSDNPASWSKQRHLKPRDKKPEVQHHAALAYDAMPVTMWSMVTDETDAALMLRFIILTAARYGEVAQATWSEINLREGIWTVPASRMKTRLEHVVPLSAPALEVLRLARERRPNSTLLFPGAVKGKPISPTAIGMAVDRHTLERVTTHGFRSTFRDWSGDVADVPREVAEAALSHTVGTKVERAYRRGTAFAKRRKLMDAWAVYCMSKVPLV